MNKTFLKKEKATAQPENGADEDESITLIICKRNLQKDRTKLIADPFVFDLPYPLFGTLG